VWKLLQFREDYRPAYYGTWTRKSESITGRTPFSKDKGLIDYDYDSESEWQEGAMECEDDGESITCSDEDGEDEEDDEEELGDSEDDGWLVPDGYLSDGEGVDEVLPDHMNPDFDPGFVQKEKQQPKKKKLVVLKVQINGPWISNGPVWSVHDKSCSDRVQIDPLQGAESLFKTPQFDLSEDMIMYIKDDLEQDDVNLEAMIAKLTIKYGKMPKKPLERRLAMLISSRKSVK
jgi:hypothetical protein